MPLVRDALRILSLYARQVSVEDAVAVLHSRFVRRPQLSPELLEPRLQRLRDLSAERVPGTVLREVLGEPFGTPSPLDAAALMTSRGSPIARRRPPSAWLRPFRELLDAWHWA